MVEQTSVSPNSFYRWKDIRDKTAGKSSFKVLSYNLLADCFIKYILRPKHGGKCHLSKENASFARRSAIIMHEI